MSVLANFHYQITGVKDAPDKLVFLHGVMGFAANWRRIAKEFENRYEILVYDQRGHGRSFHPTGASYSPDEYANDLRLILDELGWGKINLVGHSMGGRVAFHFAAADPERVTRLVIEDIGPSITPLSTSLVIRLLDATPVPFASKRAAKEWFDTEFMQLFKNERRVEDLAAYLYANLTEDEQKRAVWRFDERGIRLSIEQGHSHDYWDDLRDLSVETLVVRGELSRDLPRDVFAKMLTYNSCIKGCEILGSGHWIHSEKPEAFLQALELFFRGEPLPNVL